MNLYPRNSVFTRYLPVYSDTLLIGCVFFCEPLLVTNVYFSDPARSGRWHGGPCLGQRV